VTTAAIVVALAMAAGFGPAAARCSHLLPPRQATWLISAGAAVSALCALAVLALLAALVVGQVPQLADRGHWSTIALRHHELAEPGVGVVAVALLAEALVALALAARRQLRGLLAAYRYCRRVPGAVDALVVVPDGPAQAAAVPGRPGRVVVGQPVLAALSAPERRALLAHERAHLAQGHHWHRAAVELAAAANPLLAPLRAAIVYATERWADESAATDVGSRRDVATALARVALMARPPAAGLAMAAQAVPARVEALLTLPPRSRPLVSLGLAAIPLVGALAVLMLIRQTDHVFDFAIHVYALSHAG
jgi:Zn-dependent protease with chaperone function